MTDTYERLARSLDKLPNGFPSTESGVELKILQKIFAAQEAEMALEMTPEPETAEAIAARFGKSLPEMQKIPDGMAEKGQIGSIKIGGQHMYMLAPFFIGIYEFQLKRIDKELSELFEEYLPALTKTVGAFKPALMRVVPVNSQIKAEFNVPRYDDLRRMVKESRSFQLLECICRKEKSLLDDPCKHDPETCLGFSTAENAFDKYTKGRVLTTCPNESIKLIRKPESEHYKPPANIFEWNIQRADNRFDN